MLAVRRGAGSAHRVDGFCCGSLLVAVNTAEFHFQRRHCTSHFEIKEKSFHFSFFCFFRFLRFVEVVVVVCFVDFVAGVFVVVLSFSFLLFASRVSSCRHRWWCLESLEDVSAVSEGRPVENTKSRKKRRGSKKKKKEKEEKEGNSTSTPSGILQWRRLFLLR